MKISQIIVVAAFAALLAGHPTAASQDEALPTGSVCLSRPLSPQGGQNNLAIVVPQESIAAMESKGFSQLSCAEAFRDRQDAIMFRDWICLSASIATERAQQRYERRLGERPAVLCGMAEKVLGPWRRR